MRIAGVDIGGTNVKIGVFEEKHLIYKTSVRTPQDNPEAVCALIADILLPWNVQFVGVGTAGSVEFRYDTVSASNLGWYHVKFREMLSSKLNLPVWVDNDAQAALMAEWHDGVCQGAECAIYLTLGTGIGGAMIINGKPYRGPRNLGAEFGHMMIHPNGPRCTCGRRGCLEYYASATGLKRMAGVHSTRSVISSAQKGEPSMVRIFNKYIHELCIGMNNLIMIFDPDVIVLGGGISGAGDFLSSSCQKELQRMFQETTDPLYCMIQTAKHQNDAGIYGAMLLAMEHLK